MDLIYFGKDTPCFYTRCHTSEPVLVHFPTYFWVPFKVDPVYIRSTFARVNVVLNSSLCQISIYTFLSKNKKLPSSISTDEGEVSEEEEDETVAYSNGDDKGKTINDNEAKNGTLGFSFKNSNKISSQKVFISCLL